MVYRLPTPKIKKNYKVRSCGKAHSLCRECWSEETKNKFVWSDERKKKISLSNRGRVKPPLSEKTKFLISEARKIFYHQHPEALEKVSNQLRSMRRIKGYSQSEEFKQRAREKAQNHSALDLPECKCWVHSPYKSYDISPLQWRLLDFLVNAGVEIIIPEAKIGPYRIDALLVEEWVAFEADGDGWHKDKKHGLQRDNWLFQKYNLHVVRLTQKEVNALV